MLKVKVDNTNNKLSLQHDMFCREHTVDEIVKILDIIIADYEIKTVPRNNKLSLEEKKALVVSLRTKYLELMAKQDCTCTEYLTNDTTHIKS